MSLEARLRAVEVRIAAATQAAGRAPGSVTLVAVSKQQPIAALCAAYDAGVRDFGENVAQELQTKAVALARSGRRPRWHFIGRLQRNKAALVLAHAHLVHSVNRVELADAMAKRVPGLEPAAVLIQVNVAREAQKGGVDPDGVLDLALRLSQHATLRLEGLMTVPPAEGDPGNCFRALAQCLEQIRAHSWGAAAHALSMGMSHDFEAAIACGATLVRVGTAIFGTRDT